MERMYWEIEDYRGSVINLMEEGKTIEGQKLTKKQVESAMGLELGVCPAEQEPDIVVSAKFRRDGLNYYDARSRLRGTTKKYYSVKEATK